MTRASLQGRLIRLTRVVEPDSLQVNGFFGVGVTDKEVIAAMAEWAGTTLGELVAEAARLRDLCTESRAWSLDARLVVVAGDAGTTVDDIRADLDACRQAMNGVMA